MNRNLLLLLFLAVAASVFFQNCGIPSPSEKIDLNSSESLMTSLQVQELTTKPLSLDILGTRIYTDALRIKFSDRKIDLYVASFNLVTGQWDQDISGMAIDYADTSLAWPALKHLQRLTEIAVAHESAASKYFKSYKVKDVVIKGLQFWFANMTPPRDCDENQPLYCSQGWTRNDILQPEQIGLILTLMNLQIPKSLRQVAVKYWFRDITEIRTSNDHWGANQLALSKNKVLRGHIRLLNGDFVRGGEEIQQAIFGAHGIYPLVKQVAFNKDGIQNDWSFHQHKMFYSVGYGLSFFEGLVAYQKNILSGTDFSLNSSQLKILSDGILNGLGRMVRGPLADYSGNGRFMTNKAASESAIALAAVCENLATLIQDQSTKERLLGLKNHIQGVGATYSYLGHTHFWNSDFTVHQRPAFYSSVRLSSNRLISSENINGDLQKGFWTGYGMNFTLLKGDEYKDIFPVWNWAFLPGVTSPEIVPEILGTDRNSGYFAGGVSDGRHGVTGFFMNDIKETSATKAWFFFDDQVVALGSGISSSSTYAVNSTVNQTLLQGAVQVNGRPFTLENLNSTAVRSVFHNGIGYVFPVAGSVALKLELGAVGNWKNIGARNPDEEVVKDVFRLWIPHGLRPQDQSYYYAIYPGISSSQFEYYLKNNPIVLRANNKKVQSVRHGKLKKTAAVFYVAGEVIINTSYSFGVDQPALVLLDEANSKVSVSQPPQGTSVVTSLKFYLKNRKTNRSKVYDILLPQNDAAGKTITIPIRFP